MSNWVPGTRTDTEDTMESWWSLPLWNSEWWSSRALEWNCQTKSPLVVIQARATDQLSWMLWEIIFSISQKEYLYVYISQKFPINTTFTREISDTAPLISGTRWDWFLIIITVQHNTGGPDKHNYTKIDNNNKRYKEGKREKKFSGDKDLPDKVHTYPAKTSFFSDQNITLPTPRPYGSLPWPSKLYKITGIYGLKLTVKAIRHI